MSTSPTRPLVLVANDDGIESHFLHALASALYEHFRVAVAAPAHERSWIGKAISRHSPVTVEEIDDYPYPAWAIDGTPADCVNIALGNLLDETPALVASGINIGYNCSAPMILSSGTVGAAVEAVGWEIPAMAFSLALSKPDYEATSNERSTPPDVVAGRVAVAAQHAAAFVRARLACSDYPTASVDNINFPEAVTRDSPVVRTVPAPLRMTRLFSPDPANGGRFCFDFHPGRELPSEHTTDRGALATGKISWSILEFSQLGTIPGRFSGAAESFLGR